MEGNIGEIRLFAGNFAPRAWAYCNGQLLPISQNTALFSIIGTIYGGDGRTTMALPDLRGRVPISQGTGPGLSTHNLGSRGGAETVTLTTSHMANHSHLINKTGTNEVTTVIKVSTQDGDHSVPTTNSIIGKALDINGDPINMYTKNSNINLDPSTSPSTLIEGENFTTTPTGGQQPTPIMQPYLTMHYIICLQGIFPSRN
ncbi:phage tail protein [Aquimarina muelleri]|uniref:Tail Collar domain-containing protein n=1 Tax=Aquimarina muelleri TaxID=279356 RepID=A0A918N1R5_9FLAO|nr:tail fiber protein [Aquimarina muelleri]MCX2761378.1 tail fiber protein [Aquimarina muelleri]GGX13210.1 tail Collar domain-containing protein [Aquimarina muelleri]